MIMRVLLVLCVTGTLYAPAATISDPGKYELGGNIDYDSATPDSIIQITTSNVTLDMMNRVITYTGNAAGMSGIVVDSGLSNITIQNGSILNVTGTAIRIGSGCSRIQISHIETHSSSLCGIALEGIISSTVRDCSINNCTLLHTPTAIAIHFGFQNIIQNNAISQITCGIQLHSGQSNLIQNNTITNIIQTATHESSLAAGILTNTVELGSIILANTIMTSTVQGSAHPYGIKLTYTTSSFTTLTNAVHGAISNSVAWSPDGRYLAIGGDPSSGIDIRVYEFNGASLIQVATAAHGGATVYSVTWSPDGRYLAIGGGTSGGIEIRIYAFSGTSLTQITTAAVGIPVVYPVSWSPDGRYLAISGDPLGGIDVRVYEFNGASLIQVATAAHGATVYSVTWSPDGQYLAIGGITSGGIQTRVYAFNGASLTQVATATHGNAIISVSWSPDGRYLAIGGDLAGGVEVRVYSFSGISLTQVATAVYGNVVVSVSWSPDGRYLAIGGETVGSIQVRIYEFSGISLIQITTISPGAAVISLAWSPDGQYLAMGGDPISPINVNTALVFPQKIQILHNTINNIIGSASNITAGFARGRGISGSSRTNLIKANNGSSCDMNYEFVTDIFKKYQVNTKTINQGPTVTSNLSSPPL